MSLRDNSINADEYQAVRDFLRTAAGIELGDNKHYLVLSRLCRLIRQSGLQTLGQLLSGMRDDASLRLRVIEAMVTHETFWFRDGIPFTILRNRVLPELGAQRRVIRLWSAACSLGQEPYSMAMTLAELKTARPGLIGQAELVATDIAGEAIAHAKRGVYNDLAVARGLSPAMRARQLDAVDSGWQVRDAVRRQVRFRRFNLLDNFVTLGRFDVIFCRNVLIYFSESVKHDVVARLTQALLPGGYLFLGASESLFDPPPQLEVIRCRPGMAYRRRR